MAISFKKNILKDIPPTAIQLNTFEYCMCAEFYYFYFFKHLPPYFQYILAAPWEAF